MEADSNDKIIDTHLGVCLMLFGSINIGLFGNKIQNKIHSTNLYIT